ncbi:hypothetical protein EDD86DRAFT_247295 [Gorgonomyces haynaldii]|nr:hypothetical protein EDD86DRAFT_247295 [Gorgonomyces haynaldii]
MDEEVLAFMDMSNGDTQTAIMLFMDGNHEPVRRQSVEPIEIPDEVMEPIPPRREQLQTNETRTQRRGPLNDVSMDFTVQGSQIPRPTDPFRTANRQQQTDRLSEMFQPPFEIMHDNSVCAFDRYSEEGQEHCTFYRIEFVPYVAIIDPLTGERVWKSNTVTDVTDFFTEVMDFQDRHQLSSVEQPMGINLTEEEEMRFNRIPALSVQEPSGKDTTRVQIRFPDGTKTVRRFNTSDKVEQVFQYVKSTFPSLFNMRIGLLELADETIASASIGGASLTLDFLVQ